MIGTQQDHTCDVLKCPSARTTWIVVQLVATVHLAFHARTVTLTMATFLETKTTHEIYQTMDNNISTRTSSKKIKIKKIEEWGKFVKCIFVTAMDKFNILPFFCLIFFLYFFVALHLVVFFLRISQPTFYRTILNFQLYILTCKRQPLLSANPTRQIFLMCLNILWDWPLKV